MAGILWFKDCSYKNKELVGGKCCSLGELYNLSKKMMFSVSDGFAITTLLYDKYIEYNHLNEKMHEYDKINMT
jgi:phosphoenolpyruvate synthase/pyruvate phosphate dikinase